MLKPVGVPNAPNDIAGWERLRAYLVSAEMDGDAKLTPAQAAQQADARLVNIFRSLHVGQALPLPLSAPSRESGLPGGMRTEDGRVWLIVSRPEDERSSFPKEEWIQPDLLRSMAESYDPEAIHRAPVVLPEGGPAHWTGEFSREMAGDIDGLEFDGLHLWALVKERDGRVKQAVADGLGNRSIRWWPKYPAAGGAPYLRHLAVMAEPAGTENLGLLDHFFLNDQKAKGRSPVELDDWQKLAVCDRNLGEIPTLDADAVSAAKETVMAKEPENVDIAKIVEATVTRVLAAQPNPQTPAQTPDIGEQVRAAVTAAMASTNERIAAAEQAAKEAKETLAAATKEGRKAEIARACDQLVREGRLSPPVRAILEPSLADKTDEQLRATFEELQKLPIGSLPTRELALSDPETGDSMAVPSHLTAPPETGLIVADPLALKVEAKARAAAEKETDPAKQRQVYERELIRGFGGGADSGPTLSFLN